MFILSIEINSSEKINFNNHHITFVVFPINLEQIKVESEFKDYSGSYTPSVSMHAYICCPRDCVSRHNGGTSGAPLKPLRVDSALRALSSLRGLRGALEVPPLCRETQSLGQQMLNAPVGINGLNTECDWSSSGTLIDFYSVLHISLQSYTNFQENCKKNDHRIQQEKNTLRHNDRAKQVIRTTQVSEVLIIKISAYICY